MPQKTIKEALKGRNIKKDQPKAFRKKFMQAGKNLDYLNNKIKITKVLEKPAEDLKTLLKTKLRPKLTYNYHVLKKDKKSLIYFYHEYYKTILYNNIYRKVYLVYFKSEHNNLYEFQVLDKVKRPYRFEILEDSVFVIEDVNFPKFVRNENYIQELIDSTYD